MAAIDEVVNEGCSRMGAINYVISKMLKKHVAQRKSYDHINDVLGVVIGVLLEFYRREAAPYEDMKIEENSDI